MKPLTADERSRRRAAYARQGLVIDTFHIPIPAPRKKERIMSVDLRSLAARRIARQRLAATPSVPATPPGSIPGAVDADAEQKLGSVAAALGLAPPFDAAAIVAAVQSLTDTDSPAAIMAASRRAGLSDRVAKMLATTPRMTTAGVRKYVALRRAAPASRRPKARGAA